MSVTPPVIDAVEKCFCPGKVLGFALAMLGFARTTLVLLAHGDGRYDTFLFWHVISNHKVNYHLEHIDNSIHLFLSSASETGYVAMQLMSVGFG